MIFSAETGFVNYLSGCVRECLVLMSGARPTTKERQSMINLLHEDKVHVMVACARGAIAFTLSEGQYHDLLQGRIFVETAGFTVSSAGVATALRSIFR